MNMESVNPSNVKQSGKRSRSLMEGSNEIVSAKEKFDISSSRILDLKSLQNQFGDIIKRKWKLYSATPLWNISYETVRNGYTNANLIREIMSQAYSIVKNKKPLDIQFSLLDDSHSQTPPLQFRILQTDDDQSKLLYNGIFIAYSSKESNSTYLHLPILLCSGRISFIGQVNSILMKYFDCTISEIQFTQHNFKWIAALATHCAEDAETVSLVYTNVRGKIRNAFDHSIPFHRLANIWTCIHEEDSSIVTDEEVSKFHAALEEHWQHSLMLEMTALHLKTIVFPNEVSVDVAGTIHIANGKMMDVIFRFLNSLLPTNKY